MLQRDALCDALILLAEAPEVMLEEHLGPSALLAAELQEYRQAWRALHPPQRPAKAPPSEPELEPELNQARDEAALSQARAAELAPQPPSQETPRRSPSLDRAVVLTPVDPPRAPASWREPDEAGIRQATLVLVNTLPELFEALGAHLKKRHILERIERLEGWTLRREYLWLDPDVQRELMHYLVARIRSVQEELPSYEQLEYQRRFARIVAQLRDHFEGRDVGFIYGLSLDHEPAHGSTWLEDALHWQEIIEGRLKAPERVEPSRSSSSSSKADPSPRSGWSLEKEDERVVAAFKELHGKHLVLVGGSSTSHQIERFKALAKPSEFEWIESEQNKGVRQAQSLSNRLQSGQIDAVIVFTRAVSHAESGMLREATKRAPHAPRFVAVEGSFGTTGVALELERTAPR